MPDLYPPSVPHALNTGRPKHPEAYAPAPLAWGPFTVIREADDVLDFGICLRVFDDPDSFDQGPHLTFDSADRRHTWPLRSGWIVRGDTLRVDTAQGWAEFRPVVESDRDYAVGTLTEGSFVAQLRRSFFPE